MAGILIFLLKTSDQSTSLKNGCYFIYYESFMAPRRFLGSRQSNFLMMSLASNDIVFGIFNGPLNKESVTFLCFRIRLLFLCCSKEEGRPSVRRSRHLTSTNRLFLNDPAWKVSMVRDMRPSHKNFR